MPTGVLYDSEAKDRMQEYANQQSSYFLNAQKTTQNKEWLVISLIAAVSASIILVSVKLLKK